MEFCERLIRLRKECGYSQEELGHVLNVSRQTVSKWEMGQTTPEMNKLLAMSEHFDISVDELVKGYTTGHARDTSRYQTSNDYEYKSKVMISGVPLVHVNIGRGMRRAKGIIAIGNVATGVIAIGAIAIGIIPIGALSVGIAAFGAVTMGVLACGGVAIGALACGGVAIGVVALGGASIGTYSIGGLAVASRVAIGDYAVGNIAIGNTTSGANCFVMQDETSIAKVQDIMTTIKRVYPDISNRVVMNIEKIVKGYWNLK